MPGWLDTDERVRSAVFAHLDRLLSSSPDGSLRSADINTFAFEGRAIRLIAQTGIWKPAGFESALSIRTTYTPPDRQPPYADNLGPEGMVRYKYRGKDPQHSDNRALRQAMQTAAPLAYFIGIERGVYVPRYPVWVVEESSVDHEFTVAVDEAQRTIDLTHLAEAQREYLVRLTNTRLHQPVFRARVLRAYDETCAMCRLRHPRLLDAAHIIPDGRPRGEPVVPNGLSLCKLHHAAYDSNILGIRRDLVVEVQPRILSETDGPMLQHGLKGMSGAILQIPTSRAAQPDPDRLEERYREFRQTG
jgi:putative restriction endonuclease